MIKHNLYILENFLERKSALILCLRIHFETDFSAYRKGMGCLVFIFLKPVSVQEILAAFKT